jgi:putative ABC transport system permease protein
MIRLWLVEYSRRFDATPLSFTADLNDAIIISYPQAEELAGQVPLYEILARPRPKQDTSEAVRKANASLTKSRGGEKDFSIVTQDENLQVVNKILGQITALVSGVAAIALLVSGISIMNIMLVSVTERMHEIGVRKAIGATKRQIIGQFLSEAIILSVAGGFIGIILSFIVEYFIRLWSSLEPVITWRDSLLVLAVTLIVGVIFGSIPALKAARKDPIDALRYE